MATHTSPNDGTEDLALALESLRLPSDAVNEQPAEPCPATPIEYVPQATSSPSDVEGNLTLASDTSQRSPSASEEPAVPLSSGGSPSIGNKPRQTAAPDEIYEEQAFRVPQPLADTLERQVGEPHQRTGSHTAVGGTTVPFSEDGPRRAPVNNLASRSLGNFSGSAPHIDNSELRRMIEQCRWLVDRYEHSGALPELEEAITVLEVTNGYLAPSHPEKAACLNNLGNALQHRFKQLGDLADLVEAITAQRQAVDLTPDSHHNKPIYLNNLGTSLESRFERLGNLVDLGEAITVQKRAVRFIPNGHPNKPTFLSDLGISLKKQFERLGNLNDLNGMITAQQEAVRSTPDDHADKPTYLNNLGTSFTSRFLYLGTLSNLDQAITNQREAVRLLPDGHSDKPMFLNNLGIALEPRFQRLGNLVDLDEAITAREKAVYLIPYGHPDKAEHLNHLGITLERRFERLGDVVDFDKAIAAQQEALCLTPDSHPDKPARFRNLGYSFERRFQRLGDVFDLSEAITARQEAVRLTPDGHPDQPACLKNLGNSLESRFQQLGDLTDLDAAITAKWQAVHIVPDDHPDKPGCLNALGASLQSRLRNRHDNITLAQAISIYSQSARASAGPPSVRFTAAREWAALCFSVQSSETLDAYSTLINILPRLVWLGRTVEQRYKDISSLGNAVADAVVAGIHFGKLNLAMEWMEQGRSIVWGQMLQLRTPLHDPRQRHPQEADRLKNMCRSLESAGAIESSGDGTPQALEEAAQAHRRRTEEYERLVEHIRSFPDLSQFLHPHKSASLSNVAVSGPVVIVNTHEDHSDALILLPNSSQISHVALPGLHAPDMFNMHLRLTGLIRGTHVEERAGGPVEVAALSRWDEEMSDILGQLWRHITEPILRHLDLLKKPAVDKLPHITWCLTGYLTFLPVHAAGLYSARDQPKIFDYVVSSYTPTLAALRSARHPHNPGVRTPRLLAVSQPETPHQTPLPGTVHEVDAIQTIHYSTGRLPFTRLDGQAATVTTVLQSMNECNWVHLACHGIQNDANATDSAFLLFDGPLTLKEIMKQSFSHTELAVLSACQTAKGDSKLPDEAIHLAAGMLMAGYRSVVGTMWSIRDDDAPIIAERFYTYLIEEAGGDSTKAAYALHHAVGHLRDSSDGHDFARWVPFIHLGDCSTFEYSTHA